MAIHEPSPAAADAPGPLLRLISDRRVAFVLVGGFNTAFAFLLFVGFHQLLGDGWFRNELALLCTNVVSVLTAFVLHRNLVFRVRGHVWLDLARFIAVNLGMIVANFVLLPLLVHVFGMEAVPAQLVITVVTVVASYVGHSLFSFRRSRHEQAGAPDHAVHDPAHLSEEAATP